MKIAADDLALALGIGHALERLEKARAGVDGVQLQLEVAPENVLHLLALAFAEQAVVDKDALELVADRLVQQRRRDRRIDAAAEAEQHAIRADLACAPPRRSISMKPCIVQFGSAPQMPSTKLERISAPRGVWATSG